MNSMSPNPQLLAALLQRGGQGAPPPVGANGGVIAPESPTIPSQAMQQQAPPPPFQPPANSMFMGYLPGVTQDMIPKGKSTTGMDFTTQPGSAGWYVPNHFSDS